MRNYTKKSTVGEVCGKLSSFTIRGQIDAGGEMSLMASCTALNAVQSCQKVIEAEMALK